MYVSAVGAADRCESIASSLIRAAMITPSDNINDAIIANLNYRNKMAKEITDGNKAILELADLSFQCIRYLSANF